MLGSILIEDKDAQQSLANIEEKAKKIGDSFRNGIQSAAKWGEAIVAGAANVTNALFQVSSQSGQSANRINKMSQQLGLSQSAFQTWDFILSQSGVSIDSMNGGMGTLSQRMAEAISGTGTGAEAFARLGISIDESMSQEEAFEQTVRSLQDMEHGIEKAELAQQLFGQSGQELLPLLNNSRGSIDELKQSFNELGLEMSDEAVEAGVMFTNTMDQLKRSFDFLFAELGGRVMPIFQEFADWIIENMPTVQQVFDVVFDAISEGVSHLVDWIQTLTTWLSEWGSNNEETLLMIWESFQEYLGVIREFIGQVFEDIRLVISEVLEFLVPYIQEILLAIKEFWQENGSAILENAITVFESIRETVFTAMSAVGEIIEHILDLVVPFIVEKLEMIQQFWAENGERIMEAVQNAFSFIQSIIEFVMPAIKVIIETVWGMIEGIINGALNMIMGLINTFSGLLTGDWSAMWEGIKQLLSGALEFVWNLINLTLVGRVVSLIRSFVTSGLNLIRNLGSNITSVFQNMLNSVVSTVSNLLSRVTNIFTNLRTNISNAGSRILNAVKKPFDDALSFLSNLGSNFLQAGRNIIDSIISGITGSIGKVKDAIGNVAETIRGFFPFSEPKEGPMRGITRIDFAGTIGEAIDRSENDIRAKMDHMLKMPDIDSPDFGHLSSSFITSKGTQQKVIHVNLSGNTFNDRNDIDYLVDELARLKF